MTSRQHNQLGTIKYFPRVYEFLFLKGRKNRSKRNKQLAKQDAYERGAMLEREMIRSVPFLRRRCLAEESKQVLPRGSGLS